MKKTFILIIILLLSGLPSLNSRSLNFKVGLFSPVLASDLWDINMENLVFQKEDMMDLWYGIEYEHFMGKNLSVTLEAGTYSQSVFSQYSEFVYDDDSPIYQNMYLSITSLDFNFKLYPLGFRRVFIPFFGGGAGIYSWKYEQWGDFIDFEYGSVNEGFADTSEYSLGFNARGGFIFRFKRYMGISFEAKYHYLKGTLSSFFEGFEKLDLSGLTFNIGLNIYFR
ncbi:MAG: hypothetical protein ABFR75_08155 [Acidobacteriota bacterium]